jgi:hypothetical protein
VQLLRSNVEEIDVEDEATCPAAEWVEEALKGITIKIIRGRLISRNSSGWDANTENTTPRALCVRAALAIQRLRKSHSGPPSGPCSSNVDSPGAKVVAPLTLPGLAILSSGRYPSPLGFTERSDEVVAIFKPTEHPNQFINVLSILWVVGLLAHPAPRLLIFVNTSQFRVDERHVAALSAVGPDAHGFERIVHAVNVNAAYELLFLTLDEYEERVGREQFALETQSWE